MFSLSLLFFLQLFYINPGGLVSAPTYPSSLSIVELGENVSQESGAPPAFLHVSFIFMNSMYSITVNS